MLLAGGEWRPNPVRASGEPQESLRNLGDADRVVLFCKAVPTGSPGFLQWPQAEGVDLGAARIVASLMSLSLSPLKRMRLRFNCFHFHAQLQTPRRRFPIARIGQAQPGARQDARGTAGQATCSLLSLGLFEFTLIAFNRLNSLDSHLFLPSFSSQN